MVLGVFQIFYRCQLLQLFLLKVFYLKIAKPERPFQIFLFSLNRLCKGLLRKFHLNEVFVKINGERHYLWRAVDHEGEVLESYVTKKRDKKAALKFMKKAMRRYGSPDKIVTDKLRSYSAATKELGCSDKQVTERWANNRVENSHLPFRRRERAMLRFRRMHSLQKFASIHASFHNLFNSQRSLSTRSTFKLNRDAALAEWRSLVIS